MLLRARSRPPSLPRPRWVAPLLTTATATAMLPDQRPRSPRLTVLGDGPSPWPGHPPDDPVDPPDPRRAWTAEVQWSDTCFAVIARAGQRSKEVSLATSRPLQWPPADQKAVTEMSRAVERLEASMLAAGWTPLPPGDAWYSKRFTWVATVPRPETAPPTGRFKRQTEWPADSEQLWRCEIKWHAGYVNSDFRAVAHGPKRHRGVTLGHSETFKWLLMDDPEASDARFVGQVRRLADRLIAAGWEPVGRGPSWYELRFVLAAGGRAAGAARSRAREGEPMTARVTRAGFLWAGAAAAGGATVALRDGDGASHAAESKSSDREILAFFLTLEQVQEAFYRQAVDRVAWTASCSSSRAASAPRSASTPRC